MTELKLPIRYRRQPLFGFDIGRGSIKVVQLGISKGKKAILEGYGKATFDAQAIQDGEIADFETVAKTAASLFRSDITGTISASRVAASLPVSHSFNRVLSLPPMQERDVLDAIRLEIEQYVPVPVDDLYIDYQLIEKSKEIHEYVVAAAPKRVVDSYMNLFEILGLEVAVMEPSIIGVTRMVRHSEESDLPTLVIDCGSSTTDLIIYNREAVRVTGTIKFGGDTLTQSLARSLGVSEAQAHTIKSKYGLEASKKQAQITSGLEVPLKSLINEVKKIIRYFEDRGTDEKVEQIILLGGGANMPGFSTHLTSNLRIPTRLCGIWQHISFDGLQPPNQLESTVYATATGLALITPEEIIR